jgi:predicted regulator of Ras-like GTPase activity (Roadblock/LC7/MglB family)
VGGRTYVLVTQYDDNAYALIDISSPREPTVVASSADLAAAAAAAAAASATAAADDVPPSAVSGLLLEGASGVAIFSAAGSELAMIASEFGSGVQLLNLTEPRAPTPIRAIVGSAGLFPMVRGATTVVVASSVDENCTLALVGSHARNGAQLIDISQPWSPLNLTSIRDGAESGGPRLGGPTDVALTSVGGQHYAFVCSSSDSVVQVYHLNVSAACELGRAQAERRSA